MDNSRLVPSVDPSSTTMISSGDSCLVKNRAKSPGQRFLSVESRKDCGNKRVVRATRINHIRQPVQNTLMGTSTGWYPGAVTTSFPSPGSPPRIGMLTVLLPWEMEASGMITELGMFVFTSMARPDSGASKSILKRRVAESPDLISKDDGTTPMTLSSILKFPMSNAP